jgi:hypothetical protein
VEENDFLKYSWQVSFVVEALSTGTQRLNCFQTKNIIQTKYKLTRFLEEVLPERLPAPTDFQPEFEHIQTKDDFLRDVEEGMKAAPMAIRLTPHILSVADWSSPLQDPIRRQFIPLKSTLIRDHPALSLDSLHETEDSPVEGLVHRYPDKVLFLGKPRPNLHVLNDDIFSWSDSNINLSGILPLLHQVIRRGWPNRFGVEDVDETD